MTLITLETPLMVTIDVADWYRDPEFLEAIENNPVMTWHVKGREPTDYSDVLLWVDPSLNGEGADESDIPDRYWDAVIEAVKQANIAPRGGPHVLVRLRNLEEDQ